MSSFSISHQGKKDVQRHLSGAHHKQNTRASDGCQTINSFFKKKSEEQVTYAEVLYTGYLLEHNLPFEAAAHARPLFRKIFPDSEIAKTYGCAATKTAAIINYAMAPGMLNPVLNYFQQNPFSLAIDGSSDTGTESMYPLVVCIYDVNRGEVTSCFWHMCLISNCTAKGIFEQVSSAFAKYSVPWENVIGLSLDNASVNMGKHKGLYRHFESKNPCVHIPLDVHVISSTILQIMLLKPSPSPQALILVTFWWTFFILTTVPNDKQH